MRWQLRQTYRRAVRADRRGLMVRKGDKRSLHRWEDIAAMWRPFGGFGVAIRVNGRRVGIEPAPVQHASLSLLARTEGLRPHQLLLAAWECHTQDKDDGGR
jgi:hypothetical protein